MRHITLPMLIRRSNLKSNCWCSPLVAQARALESVLGCKIDIHFPQDCSGPEITKLRMFGAQKSKRILLLFMLAQSYVWVVVEHQMYLFLSFF